MFSPDTVKRIRSWAKGKRVIFIDYNGIVGGYSNGELINPEALKTLSELKNIGYSLVLWTTASNEVSKILKKNKLLNLFEFEIYGNNYLLKNPDEVINRVPKTFHFQEYDEEGNKKIVTETHLVVETRRNQLIEEENLKRRILYDQVLKSTKWISKRERKLIDPNHISRGSFNYKKPIQLLLPSACIVDDSITRFMFQEDLPDSLDRYVVIQPNTFNPVSYERFPKTYNKKVYFTPDILPIIIENYPPPKYR